MNTETIAARRAEAEALFRRAVEAKDTASALAYARAIVACDNLLRAVSDITAAMMEG